MRQITKFLALTFLAMLLTGSAWADTILGPGLNNITFTNFENRIPAPGSNSDNIIAAGDIFYGIATISQIDWDSTVDVSPDWAPIVSGENQHYLQGFFWTKVQSVNYQTGLIEFTNVGSGDQWNIISAEESAAGVVLKWFESSTTLSMSNLDNSIASATDGSLWMSLSIANGYWWSSAATTIPSDPGANVGNSFYGLNLVGGSVQDLYPINDINEGYRDLDVDFYGQAKIYTADTTQNYSKIWDFYSSDPAVVATPEPGTLLLLGAGLLGLGAVARRRKN